VADANLSGCRASRCDGARFQAENVEEVDAAAFAEHLRSRVFERGAEVVGYVGADLWELRDVLSQDQVVLSARVFELLRRNSDLSHVGGGVVGDAGEA
jgi:hypothetical protein